MTEYKVAGVTDNGHICFSKLSQTLCDERINSEVRLLPDYENPAEDTNQTCSECKNQYEGWIEDNGSRAPTVRCECDMISKQGIETCDSVVSAYKARELSHPSEDRNMPVCPNCYRWICSIDTNSVTTPYEEAKQWLQNSAVPESQKQHKQ